MSWSCLLLLLERFKCTFLGNDFGVTSPQAYHQSGSASGLEANILPPPPHGSLAVGAVKIQGDERHGRWEVLCAGGQLTFLLPSGSRPPSFSPTAILSSSRLSSSHKWLQGCSQARLPRCSLRVALTRSLEKHPGSPAPCSFPPSNSYYFWDAPVFVFATQTVPRPGWPPK